MSSRPSTLKTYNSLKNLIPGGVNSPVRACLSVNQIPLIVNRGKGDRVFDVDGNSYLDFCGSWGALIHGHAHPQIIDAVKKRAELGTSFGITTEIEEKLANKVVSIIDSIEKIRFVSSGTEATMSAVRLARGYTGKEVMVKFSGNYHGHADHFLVKAGSGVLGLNSTSSSSGIPQDIVSKTVSLPYNDLKVCRDFFHHSPHVGNIAAVIIEPISGNMGVVPAKKEFLEMLREETEKAKALLIIDEVITGFRMGLKGAQHHFGIKPDLTCLGKIVGGGFPAAAFGGRADVMDCLAPIGQVYQAGTLSGNPIAMEAGLQAITLLEQKGFYEELQRKTDIITKPIQEMISRKNLNMCLQQAGSMFTLFFGRREVNNLDDALQLDLAKFSEFFNAMLAKGIYVPPSQHEALFVSMAHEDAHLVEARDAIMDFLECS